MTRDEEDDDLGKTLPQPPVSIPPILLAQVTHCLSSIVVITRMVTTQLNIPSPEEESQKASDSLSNLHIDETNMDGALEVTFERVPCIRYLITFCRKSVST